MPARKPFWRPPPANYVIRRACNSADAAGLFGDAAHGCVRNEGVSAIEKFELLHAALLRLEAERNARVTDPLFARYALPIPLNIGTLHAGQTVCSIARHGVDASIEKCPELARGVYTLRGRRP